MSTERRQGDLRTRPLLVPCTGSASLNTVAWVCIQVSRAAAFRSLMFIEPTMLKTLFLRLSRKHRRCRRSAVLPLLPLLTTSPAAPHRPLPRPAPPPCTRASALPAPTRSKWIVAARSRAVWAAAAAAGAARCRGGRA